MTLQDKSRQNEIRPLATREPGMGVNAIIAGLIAAGVLVLSLVAALAIGQQESRLVVQMQATATPTARATTLVVLVPTATSSATSIPPTSPPTPSTTREPAATASPTPSPTCAPPRSWRPYTVQTGDSLALLAMRYQTSPAALQDANCLSSPHLTRGQVLYVPRVVATSTPCRPPSTWVRYIVKSGDTLSSIARRVGSTVAALKQANCRSSDTIYVGETLWVPRLPATPTRHIPVPTSTRRPTSTPPGVTPSPTTGTPTPSPTESGTVEPTDSATPTPTGTGSVEPTDTSVPPTDVTPGDTPVPPTDVAPSDTPVPPTEVTPSDTPVPPTEIPPTNTPRPTVAPSDTPALPIPEPTRTPAPTKEPTPSPAPSDGP